MLSNPPPQRTQEPDKPDRGAIPPVHPRAANRGWLARARASGLKGGSLLSFLALSLYANADGEAMVSQVRLASDTGVSERTIRNHRRRWERAGLLDERTRCGPRGLTLYRLAPPDLEAAGVGPGRQGVPLEPRPADRPGPARVRPPAAPSAAETARQAVGAPLYSSPAISPEAERQKLVPTKTEGGRERSELSPAVSPYSAGARVWPKSPRALETSGNVGARTAAPTTGRGSAYAATGDAHAVAKPATPARPLAAAATATGATAAAPVEPARHLGTVRAALEAMRSTSRARQAAEQLERERNRAARQGTLFADRAEPARGHVETDDESGPLLTWGEDEDEELHEGATAGPVEPLERLSLPPGEPASLGALLAPWRRRDGGPPPTDGQGGR
jgi:hypothetical protein